jgi:hypothetical protein
MKHLLFGLVGSVMFFGSAAQAQACRGPGDGFLDGILIVLFFGLILVLTIASTFGLATGAIIGAAKGRVKSGCIWGTVGGVIGGFVGEGIFWGSGMPAWTESLGSVEQFWFIPLIIGSVLGASLLVFGALMPADHKNPSDNGDTEQIHPND